MSYPENYRYTKDHEWVLWQDGIAKVGITEFAQSELGEVVYVELPTVGKEVKAGDPTCVVESTKAASDVYSPVNGKVQTVNQELSDTPNLLNTDPHHQAWIFTLENVSEAEVKNLMALDEYLKFIKA